LLNLVFTAATIYFCIALPMLFFLFRCSFTAAQPCALVERVTPVNHHATEKVRDECITCRTHVKYVLYSDIVFMSVCRERRSGCGQEQGSVKGRGFCWTSDHGRPSGVNSTASSSRICLKTFIKRFET